MYIFNVAARQAPFQFNASEKDRRIERVEKNTKPKTTKSHEWTIAALFYFNSGMIQFAVVFGERVVFRT